LSKKFYNSLKIGPNFFLRHFKSKLVFNFVKFIALKKGMTTNFSSPLSFIAVFGSGTGMGKNQYPGSGINIPDPQHWTDIEKCWLDKKNSAFLKE
jgi:hypothetical protein